MKKKIGTETKETLLSVILICPKCFHEQEWSGSDFEEWVECPKCYFGDEAWFFWHILNPTTRIQSRFSAERVWVRSANYPNDALYLSREDFIGYSLGHGKGGYHGGDYTLRILQAEYGKDNPNFGNCQAEIEYRTWTPEDSDGKFISKLFTETKRFCGYQREKAKKVGDWDN